MSITTDRAARNEDDPLLDERTSRRPSRFGRRRSRIARGVIACGVIAVLMVGCGSDDDSSADDGTSTTATTTARDEACADGDALTASVEQLQEVDLTAEGTDAASAAIDDVKASLTAFGESAGEDLQPQVQAVTAAIDQLETAVEDPDAGGAALAAVSAVASAASGLVASLDAGCE